MINKIEIDFNSLNAYVIQQWKYVNVRIFITKKLIMKCIIFLFGFLTLFYYTDFYQVLLQCLSRVLVAFSPPFLFLVSKSVVWHSKSSIQIRCHESIFTHYTFCFICSFSSLSDCRLCIENRFKCFIKLCEFSYS